jgi:hypothetical protein
MLRRGLGLYRRPGQAWVRLLHGRRCALHGIDRVSLHRAGRARVQRLRPRETASAQHATRSFGRNRFLSLWSITFKKERRFLHVLTAARQHSLLVLRWSEAIPQNPEISSISPYPVADVVSIIRTLAENDALRPRLVSQKLTTAINQHPNPGDATAGTLETARFDGSDLVFQGWACVPAPDRPADCVVLGFEKIDGGWKPYCVVETGGNRADPRQPERAALKRAGFSGRIRATNLEPGEITLKAWAVDLQDERIFPIAGQVRVTSR